MHDDDGRRIERGGWRFARLQEEANGILGGNLWRRREEESVLLGTTRKNVREGCERNV